jgi:predicted alpha/beta superfamily hydrolase
MLRSIVLIGLLAMALFSGVAAPAGLPATQTMRSEVLEEVRSFQVDLPASYARETDRRYPLLLVLDGPEHRAHVVASTGFLARAGEMPEMIVVSLASTVRVRDFTQTDWPEAWVGGGGAGNFIRFIEAELLPALDSGYRTDGYRILMGHSAAGQFVMHVLSSKPSLFGAYIATAPSLDWDDSLPGRELVQSLATLNTKKTFFYVARADDFDRPLADFDALVAGLKASAPDSLRWQGIAWPQETHASLPLLGQVDGLRRLFSGYRFHNDRLGEGLEGAQAHYTALSERLGHAVPVPEAVINKLGYRALQGDRGDEALRIFRLNAAAHPNSANAHDSLGEALAARGLATEAAEAASVAAGLAASQDLPNRGYYQSRAEKLRAAASE